MRQANASGKTDLAYGAVRMQNRSSCLASVGATSYEGRLCGPQAAAVGHRRVPMKYVTYFREDYFSGAGHYG